jgi:hypothetical protein
VQDIERQLVLSSVLDFLIDGKDLKKSYRPSQ